MNHLYRLVWSEVQNGWIAVAESARGRGKKARRKLLVAATVSLSAAMAQATPVGAQLVSGTGSVTQSGATTTVTQGSQNLSLNWQGFNVAPNETVNFVQPSAAAIAVNRIADINGTRILGNLNANGQVYLINPNGVLFGQGAQVNVGGLVASTMNLNDASLNGSTRSFSGAGPGSIINQGTITAANGGYVALLGNTVINQGAITAPRGTVALGAGSAATLTFDGSGLVHMQVDQSVLATLAENGGLIKADGGMVVMNAGAKDALLASVVNNTGIIEARTVENHAGTITLLGGMAAGTVNLAGTLDASAPNGGNGGFIETSAAQVKVANDAKVSTAAAMGLTGTWLIDPQDYTVAASGGDITGATLSNNLGTTNVTLQSSAGATGGSGNVNVNDAVAWSANNTLTLTASNNVNINADITATGNTAGLVINPNTANGAEVASGSGVFKLNGGSVTLSGANPSLTIAGISYTVINSLGAAGSTTGTDLQGMNGNLAGHYALGSNIDATATNAWNSGAGFASVGAGGDYGLPFTGSLEGLGHSISNLTINRPGVDYGGLFGATNGSTISNVGMIGGSVKGGAYVGALVGDMSGAISNSYATATVMGSGNRVGGLVGRNMGAISNSHATGAVSGAAVLGGLAGGNASGTINNSYATGSVTGSTYLGGLVGAIEGGSVTNSYATGAVTGSGSNVGGLVGYTFASTISNTYATGAVSGSGVVGALVGYRNEAGAGPSTISNSYWNSGVFAAGMGTGTTTGATGLTAGQMQTASNFAGFNFTTTPGAAGNNWVMVDVDGTLNNAGGAAGGTRPMLASEYSTSIANAHQLQLMAMAPAASYTLANDINAAATGANTDVWGSAGFSSVGNFTTKFSGKFDGLGHTISNLTINAPSRMFVGLFGAVTGTVKNVGLVAENLTGNYGVGGLAGYSSGSISNSSVSGTIVGANLVGGLVGRNHGSISNDYATATVSSSGTTSGGLIGKNYGSISNSYATGSVTGGYYNGGLAGINLGSISNSYATGAVSGSSGSRHWSGGLVGINYSNIGTSYATGAVIGSGSTFGGLVGKNYGSATNSFWDTTSSGRATSDGGLGMATADMKSQRNFTSATVANGGVNPAWDFTNTWIGYDGFTNPLVRSFMTALTVTANSASKNYDNLAYTGGNGVTYSSTPNGNLLGTVSYGGTAQGDVNAGSYAIAPTGLYSTQQGYAINFVSGTLTVNKANLTLTTGNVTRTYDGGLTAAGTAVVAGGTLFAGNTIAGGTFAYTDKNAGGGKVVTTNGVTVNDGNGGGNYNISYVNNTASTINAANLTLSTVDVHKAYDGGLAAAGTAVVAGGTLYSGDKLAGGTFAYTDRNVGSGKTVTTTGVTVNDGNSGGNYNVSYANNTNSTIDAAIITAIAPVAPVAPIAPIAAERPASPLAATMQLLSNTFSPQGGFQTESLTLSPSISVMQGSSTASVPTGDSSTSGFAKNGMADVTMNIGTGGSTLQIKNGGMNLPARDDSKKDE